MLDELEGDTEKLEGELKDTELEKQEVEKDIGLQAVFHRISGRNSQCVQNLHQVSHFA